MAACLPRCTRPAEDGPTARETGTSKDPSDGPLIFVAALLLPPQCIAAKPPGYGTTLLCGHLLTALLL